MNAKELKAILQALQDHEVGELTLETPDYKLSVRRGSPQVQWVTAPPPTVSAPLPAPAPHPASAPVPTPPAQTSAPASPATEAPKGDTNHYAEVKAPIVGTFYAAPSPDAPPFVKEGDRVQKGQVLCIIEAMKLMNEIESEVSGTVKKLLVSNGEPVEYGQTLFLIDPA
jgi:acetyl-CoA carboxylase biotin carboxyl carrier protein